MMFIVRNRLKTDAADALKEVACSFFMKNPRRRVFRVGDDLGIWFKVRKSHIDADVDAHTENVK